MSLHTLALCILTCIIITACKKSEPEMVFDITGIPDVDMRYTEGKTFSLNAVHRSGMNDDLTLTAEGLPDGASISFKPNVQKVPFAFTMFLDTKNVKGGNYTFKIKAKPSHSNTTSAYDVKMHVKDLEDIGCAMEIAGSYEGHPTSSEIKMSRPQIISNAEKSQVALTNCTPSFFANMDCYAHTLNIPKQKTFDGFNVSGYGSYDLRTVSFNIDVENLATGKKKNHTFTLVRPYGIQ